MTDEERRERKRERERKWRAENPEKVREWMRKWRAENAENPESALVSGAKRRAKAKGLPFNLEPSDIVIPQFCPVLGIELRRGAGKSCPNSPSLDRVRPALGYVKNNVIVVSHRANSIKQNATPEEIQAVAAFFARLYSNPETQEQINAG
jgi:hypothetical protein